MRRFLRCGLCFGIAAGAWAFTGAQVTPAVQGPADPALSRAVPLSGAEVDDLTRSSLEVLSYDLDVHMSPARSGVDVVARYLVRNRGTQPLTKLALQISSTLKWNGTTGRSETGTVERLSLESHRLESDADHTGAVNEAVFALNHSLAPGATAVFTMSYAGTIQQAAVPLERAGLSAQEAARLSWDAVGSLPGEQGSSSSATTAHTDAAAYAALRGFGQVLWYPVSSPQIFLGDQNAMARATGQEMRSHEGRPAHLRLLVETAPGETAPVTAFFCGKEFRLRTLDALDARGGETGREQIARESEGEVQLPDIGFGALSLFVPKGPAVGSPVALAGVSAAESPRLTHAAAAASAVVQAWLGTRMEERPVLLDLFSGAGEGSVTPQPFSQHALLVESSAEASNVFAMARLEAHAAFRANGAWLDEGVAQWVGLLAVEQQAGRGAMQAQLQSLQPAVALAEAGTTREALVDASQAVTYRNKAVLVLNMLRAMIGDEALRTGLAAVHAAETEKSQDGTAAAVDEAHVLERALEQSSKRPLDWFFRDWVLTDSGLPDLSIVHAALRSIPGRTGSLVAVEVRNDGGAGAEVPVTVRSGTLTATERLYIPAHGTSAVRIVFEARPDEVQVNDGTVPEIGQSVHTQKVD